MLNVAVPLTVDPAAADGGTETLVLTSATGEMLVTALAVSGKAFAPWDVVVEICVATVTEPLAGAVYSTLSVNVSPLASVLGMPVSVTAPVPLSYVAVTPGGSVGNDTPVSPGVRVRV